MYKERLVCVDYINMYQADLVAITANSLAYNDLETGGAFFGMRSNAGRPVVCLATDAGPGAIRQYTHFAQDPDHLYQSAVRYQNQFGLQYLGNFHSHHSLGLTHPSGGDREQANRMIQKFDLCNMIQVIVTFSGTGKHKRVRIDAYIYNGNGKEYHAVKIRLMEGANPFRRMLDNSPFFQEESSLPEICLDDIIFDRYQDENDFSEDETILADHLSEELNSLPLQIAKTAQIEIKSRKAVLKLTGLDGVQLEVSYQYVAGSQCRIHECTITSIGEVLFASSIHKSGIINCFNGLLYAFSGKGSGGSQLTINDQHNCAGDTVCLDLPNV